ncbi:Gfo/Idh/MocA family protein [Parachryseolinea silvisoli]|uniref:Gfo/Idh/MocA family protein n=1 Tax=Parachryseolinea silvisoli TaxID=2873601 RepID=UPI002265D7E5|nr:Gfo/Idh/MocA family oxidoreductase [Parachryseolinea silvisoli]MCD9019617.1 Gfo/Idh/MocA family oxidoreductase [Parachryseolinea silvisoli]
MKRFALIGAAGFIAPRHLKAIKDTGNTLVAALDKHDNVGVLDSYFPDTNFFTEFERFDRHLDKLKRKDEPVEIISICSPNYLHDSHIRYALRYGADAICEKPLVLSPWNVDALAEIQQETGRRIYTILQLRLHPSIIALREQVRQAPKDKVYDIDLQYITSRGNWYHSSWKGDLSKSGGIATNIGVHFFDMLIWIFGAVKDVRVSRLTQDSAAGYLELAQARVHWMLSIDANDLPVDVKASGKRTFRSLTMEGKEIEFSEGFTDLHTASYADVIAGNGFGLEDARAAIEVTHQIRSLTPSQL